MLRIDKSGVRPELLIYGEITPPDAFWGPIGISSADVIDALADLSNEPEIGVRINSPGGDVFEGVAIYQALARFAGRVFVDVDALAASAASVVAMAGSVVRMAGNGMMMIHRAWTILAGNAGEFRDKAETLDKVDGLIVDTYEARCKKKKTTRDEIVAWMAAETWMTAQEAVDRGFADEVGELVSGIDAGIARGRYKNTPPRYLRPAVEKPGKPAGKIDWGYRVDLSLKLAECRAATMR